MASTLKKRNGTLELMRFVFCLAILFYHIGKYTSGTPSLKNGVFLALFPHGAMGVEFFFLLTGVFLAQSLDKQLQRSQTKTNVFADTGRYSASSTCSSAEPLPAITRLSLLPYCSP